MADISKINVGGTEYTLDADKLDGLHAASFAKDFYIGVGSTGASGVRPTKFLTVDYSSCTSETGVLLKLSMVSGHGNGSSYKFLEDIILGVNLSGDVSGNIYKFFGVSLGSYDDKTRYYGDIFYVKNTTTKVVDFYALIGQYSYFYMTPYKRLNSSTGGTITQASGTPTFYSSGTKTYITSGNYAMTSDIPKLSVDNTTLQIVL